ncbi:MAG: PIN domain-containing protein [Acidimicrobiia bacterium]
MSVLDATVLLAWLQGEQGADRVEPLLSDAVVSAANWSEVLQHIRQTGRDADAVGTLLRARGVTVEPVTEQDAVVAARYWSPDGTPLSLPDRLCLALATRLGVEAVTVERRWAATPVAVRVIR